MQCLRGMMIGCCREFCESGLEGAALQRHVDNMYPAFTCEHEICSPHSPGPVLDEEQVAFLLIDPAHYDDDRKTIVPAAFQELINRDLSVLRIAHATKLEAEATRQELVARGLDRGHDRVVDEVCLTTVKDVRLELYNDERLLGVYDTALPDKSSHASIFTKAEALLKGPLRKLVRERVHKLMTRNRQSFKEILSQLDAHQA